MQNIAVSTIVRTFCLILALINQLLSITGHPVIPIDDEQIETTITELFTIGIVIWNWWKNNSFTQNAIKADKYLEELKLNNGVE